MLLIGLGLLELFVSFGILKAFDRIWHAVLQKLHCYRIAGLSFLSNRQYQGVLVDPYLWMGFNNLKARATSRRQFTFYY